MKAKKPTFLQKTYELLGEGVAGFRWSDDGLIFGVTCVREFSDKVLPMYFKHRNFSSFVRQLNLHSFHKVKATGFEAAFCHPSFRRDCPHWLPLIERKTSESRTLSRAVSGLTSTERESLQASLESLLQAQVGLEIRADVLDERVADVLAVNRRLIEDFSIHSERNDVIEQLLGLLNPLVRQLRPENQPLSAPPMTMMLPAPQDIRMLEDGNQDKRTRSDSSVS